MTTTKVNKKSMDFAKRVIDYAEFGDLDKDTVLTGLVLSAAAMIVVASSADTDELDGLMMKAASNLQLFEENLRMAVHHAATTHNKILRDENNFQGDLNDE